MMIEDDRPLFRVRRVNNDTIRVKFRCPACKRVNIHGMPERDHKPQHRVAHCKCWPDGYFIQWAPKGVRA